MINNTNWNCKITKSHYDTLNSHLSRLQLDYTPAYTRTSTGDRILLENVDGVLGRGAWQPPAFYQKREDWLSSISSLSSCYFVFLAIIATTTCIALCVAAGYLIANSMTSVFYPAITAAIGGIILVVSRLVYLIKQIRKVNTLAEDVKAYERQMHDSFTRDLENWETSYLTENAVYIEDGQRITTGLTSLRQNFTQIHSLLLNTNKKLQIITSTQKREYIKTITITVLTGLVMGAIVAVSVLSFCLFNAMPFSIFIGLIICLLGLTVILVLTKLFCFFTCRKTVSDKFKITVENAYTGLQNVRLAVYNFFLGQVREDMFTRDDAPQSSVSQGESAMQQRCTGIALPTYDEVIKMSSIKKSQQRADVSLPSYEDHVQMESVSIKDTAEDEPLTPPPPYDSI